MHYTVHFCTHVLPSASLAAHVKEMSELMVVTTTSEAGSTLRERGDSAGDGGGVTVEQKQGTRGMLTHSQN